MVCGWQFREILALLALLDGMTKSGSESLPSRLEFAKTKARVGRSRDEDYRM